MFLGGGVASCMVLVTVSCLILPGNCGQCESAHMAACNSSQKCQKCQRGWDGDCCARENVVLNANSTVQNESQSDCSLVKDSGITIKLKVKTPLKHVEMFFPEGKRFNLTGCVVRAGKENCAISGNQTFVLGSHTFHCKEQGRKQFQFACPNKNKVLLCQVKVYKCKEFWWGPQSGCKPCQCADGKMCDQWSGVCPDTPEVPKPRGSTPGNVTGVNHQSAPPIKKESDHTFIAIVSVTAVVAAIILVAVAAIFLYRRQLNKTCRLMKRAGSSDTSFSISLPEVTSGTARGDNTQLGLLDAGDTNQTSLAVGDEQEDSVYANTVQIFVPTTTPISCRNFRNHLSYMGKNNGFTREFEALPGDQEDSVSDALLPQNINKNRFKGIYPYNSNRVFLKPVEMDGTDYINASYIDGYKESMAYIATQGPLPETIADFWHMVWSEDCGKIVMLTNLVEPPKVKCAQYWPDDKKSQTYGQYGVRCLKVNTYAHYVHRVVSLARVEDQNREQREIHQFHFTAWPDHNTPSAVALVLFNMHVRHLSTVRTGPLVVHCSAGVGRTGTYIALDVLTREAEITSCISVFSTVKQMRRQRMKMIQNLDQYQFLHKTVAETLDSRDSCILAQDVLHGNAWAFQDKQSQLPDAVKEKFFAQFQVLDCWRPALTKEETKTAVKLENSGKNRFPNVLPVEEYRVCLWAPDETSSDYINAVFLPSHLDQLGCIATQLPLENTVADFWRMTFDWKVTTVIRFLDGPSDEHHTLLLPEPGCCVSHGPLTVHGEVALPWIHGMRRQTVQVQHKEVGDVWQKVWVYLVDKPDALDMKDTAIWLSLTKVMRPVTSQGKPAPIIIQCFDGASRSCLLVALAITLRSLDESSQTSPYLTARLLQNARPQAFLHFEQYEFLIRCVVDHLRGPSDSCSDELYINREDTRQEEDATYGNL